MASATYHSPLAALGAATLALALGCTTPAAPAARTPAEAKPAPVKRISVEDRGDLLEYRSLKREDFRASEPPPQADSRRGHVAAATCAYLVPDPKLRFRAVREGNATEFTSTADGLAFAARMDPTCSWWDVQRTPFVDPSYVLEHEQIHFAIVELAARDLNRRAPEIAERLRASGPTSEVALAATRAGFEREFAEAVQRTLERSQAFDADTSLGLSREKQREWLKQVERELADTTPRPQGSPAP